MNGIIFFYLGYKGMIIPWFTCYLDNMLSCPVLKFLWFSFNHNGAPVHYQDPVAQQVRLIHIMRGDKNCRSLLIHTFYGVPQGFSRYRVKSHAWLVKD